ncbi:hypothetical protein DAEQUDRAFT_734061 [Daedalea quercina L-15889]|uniref:Uncharacterized protein n=1 Tax=Daedalea quercina L-15889 TaxID=1314783 RepID=A0A165KJL3_9APHY|nr:hypothetical protein DAEQUDRAFT_734184 [Daedalea quercina L-15889]KZT63226.1 hypothetical protein DAEQUDRAFT_734061 [Daedalea quercina L-15889]
MSAVCDACASYASKFEGKFMNSHRSRNSPELISSLVFFEKSLFPCPSNLLFNVHHSPLDHGTTCTAHVIRRARASRSSQSSRFCECTRDVYLRLHWSSVASPGKLTGI